MNENANKLLGILQSHAPNGPAQQVCAELSWELQRNSARPEDVEIGLAGALLDGLKFGNWPWIEVNKK